MHTKDSNITFREAGIVDCHELAVLKGKVWNTTYQGIYSQEKLTGYDVEKNKRILESIVEERHFVKKESK